ncbi:FadR/GntR family transcriptional regulator [Streptomyces sp. B1-3]|uniref:FadR/GntR family transcriptional regulator n=1 Tax=Streptomyces sp. B1-3 TaxID=3141453 RepID=UPI003D2DBD5D
MTTTKVMRNGGQVEAQCDPEETDARPSSPPVRREALDALVAQGFIAKVPRAGGGSFVQTVDHESLQSQLSGSLETALRLGSVSIQEVTRVRRMLELPAARLAAVQRSDEQAAELQRLIERQEEVVRGKRDHRDPELFELGMALYSLIAAASGNRLLASFVSAMSRATLPVYIRDLTPEEGDAERSRALVAAIIAQDADAADAAEDAMAAQLDLAHYGGPAESTTNTFAWSGIAVAFAGRSGQWALLLSLALAMR